MQLLLCKVDQDMKGKQKETTYIWILPKVGSLSQDAQILSDDWCAQFYLHQVSITDPLGHTHILAWGTLLCWMGCIGLVFPLSCSFSLGDFNSLELNEDVLRTLPLAQWLLPPALPPLLLDREGKKENTDVGGTAKEGLLDELCLLSEKENKKKKRHCGSGKSPVESWKSPLKYNTFRFKGTSLS